jgi:hypothetical protein
MPSTALARITRGAGTGPVLTFAPISPADLLLQDLEWLAPKKVAQLRALLEVERTQAGGMAIGPYAVSPWTDPGKVHIRDTRTGEGGTFDAAKFQRVVAAFFNDNF